MDKKILVVDDDLILRTTLGDLLLEENYRVCCVDSGESALEQIKNENFNLVLLDIKLNGMDGIQTLEKIRHMLHSNVEVILISGYITDAVIEKAKNLGILDYIRKPFDIDELLFKVSKAFDKSDLSQDKTGYI